MSFNNCKSYIYQDNVNEAEDKYSFFYRREDKQ